MKQTLNIFFPKNKPLKVNHRQLDFLVEFGYIFRVDLSDIKPAGMIIINVYEITDNAEMDMVAVSYKQDGAIRTKHGFTEKGWALSRINPAAATTLIQEFGPLIKPITDVKDKATREFFASNEPLRVLKELYETDKSKSYLRNLVDPEPSPSPVI